MMVVMVTIAAYVCPLAVCVMKEVMDITRGTHSVLSMEVTFPWGASALFPRDLLGGACAFRGPFS